MLSLFVYALISILFFKYEGFEWTDVGLSVIPGLFLVALSFITEGKVGMGDGIVTAMLGPALGLEKSIYVLMGALILNSLLSGILLLFKKAGKNTRIPFVPFLTTALGVVTFVYG